MVKYSSQFRGFQFLYKMIVLRMIQLSSINTHSIRFNKFIFFTIKINRKMQKAQSNDLIPVLQIVEKKESKNFQN